MRKFLQKQVLTIFATENIIYADENSLEVIALRINRVKLAAEMAKLDVNGKELATTAGLSRATITGVKSGKSCSRETGEKIARALGVDVAELLEGARV